MLKPDLQTVVCRTVPLLFNRKELTSSGGLTKFEIHIVAQFDNHNSQVWRVSWNITGTVLASSGDDGCVRLWKGKNSVCHPLEVVFCFMYQLCGMLKHLRKHSTFLE